MVYGKATKSIQRDGAKGRVYKTLHGCRCSVQLWDSKYCKVNALEIPTLIYFLFIKLYLGKPMGNAGEYNDNGDDVCIRCCAAAQSRLRSLVWTTTLGTMR